MPQYAKLRGRIVERFGNSQAFAKEVGLSATSVSYKLTGRREFSKSDMKTWARVLDIPESEYYAYFFEE